MYLGEMLYFRGERKKGGNSLKRSWITSVKGWDVKKKRKVYKMTLSLSCLVTLKTINAPNTII